MFQFHLNQFTYRASTTQLKRKFHSKRFIFGIQGKYFPLYDCSGTRTYYF